MCGKFRAQGLFLYRLLAGVSDLLLRLFLNDLGFYLKETGLARLALNELLTSFPEKHSLKFGKLVRKLGNLPF